MKIQAPFGFVTGCHAGDKFMVPATLASIRHYCPGVPVCLVVDGTFDVSDLVRDYNVIVLRVPDLPSAEMRKLIAGNYRAKLAAMWEGPFEFYVWLDSDAIVWGDFTAQVRQDLDFQIFWAEVSVAAEIDEVPDWLSHFYFDLNQLRQFDPEFDWRGHAYFSAGVFACRRNVITYEHWAKIEAWNRNIPGGLFKFGDMGLLNYLVHALGQRGQIKTATADLQHIMAYHGKSELIRDCSGAGWDFPKSIKRPRAVHFCGRKPCIFDYKAYSRPFTIARLKHQRRNRTRWGAWLTVLNEDFQIIWGKSKRRLGRLSGKQKS